MNFNHFVRRPFLVEAVQVSDDNIEELCKLVGTEIKKNKDRTYIALDRRVVPNVTRAYVGWWITRLGDNLRCYSPKVFTEQFMDYSPEWDDYFATEEGEEAATDETNEVAEVDTAPRIVLTAKDPEVEPVASSAMDQ